MTETWKPFREGTYEVSDLGNVRRAKPGTATFVGRPLRPLAGGTGYHEVQLCGARFYIHRVVAEAFIGPCPPGIVVNHRDGNKHNNAAGNLEYVTSKQNHAHALAMFGRRRGPTKPKPPPKGPQVGDVHWTHRMPDRIARGERMGTSKLDADYVVAIRYLVDIGRMQKGVARRFGISVAQASRIVLRKTWAHIPARQLMPARFPEWLAGGAK